MQHASVKNKGGFFTVHKQMYSKSLELMETINSLQAQINELPTGKLICSHNDNHYKWYHSDGHSKVYIPKANRQLAEQLAIKKYLTLQLEAATNEKRFIDLYLNHYRSPAKSPNQLLTEDSEYAKLLAPYFSPLSQQLADWSTAPYERSSLFPEQLIHKGSSGNLVRSKSEAIIDMLLYTNKVPFRYECALHLNNSTIYPDFTIRHPKTGRTFYWEHFGLMDNPSYAQKTFSKLQLYNSHGIVPSVQLITTYETKENPLSPEVVEKIISHYFL